MKVDGDEPYEAAGGCVVCSPAPPFPYLGDVDNAFYLSAPQPPHLNNWNKNSIYLKASPET